LFKRRDTNRVLSGVWQALRIGMQLSKTYTRFSGLDQLIALNSRGGLSDTQKAEFRGKYNTASAVAAFVTAYYVVWDLSQYKTEETAALSLEFGGLPELSLQDPVRALDCLIFYYGSYLERSGVVRTDLDFLKLYAALFSRSPGRAADKGKGSLL